MSSAILRCPRPVRPEGRLLWEIDSQQIHLHTSPTAMSFPTIMKMAPRPALVD